jgi:hypothetical protein
MLDRLLRAVAVAAVHDARRRDAVRRTSRYHLCVLRHHCVHDMEHKQATDAGPKQTTVAQ